MSKERVIKAYKGFNPDMTCRGFQYEVGKEYEIEGGIQICEKGFHACESPLEVLDHYPIFGDNGENRFCEVEQSGAIDKEKDSTKVCSSKIKINAELKLADLINLGVEWIKEQVKFKEDENISDSSGDSAQIGSSGNYAKIGSSGDSAQIGSSGNYAKIGSSGYSAQIGSSGYYAQIGSSGNSAKIGSSGDSAKIDSTGNDCVICCAGNNSIAKAKVGSWITLSEWAYSSEKGRNIPKCVKTEYVDGERIKADIWYKLVDGEFKKVKP